MGTRWGQAGSLAVLATLCAVLVVLAAPRPASSAPEPSPVVTAWELDFEPGKLRATVEQLPGQEPRAYLYMTYRVVNRTGEDLLFAPRFDLATDEAEVRRSGADVPIEVTERIKENVGRALIEDQVEILGPLLQGPENAREGLVIWKADDLDVDKISVYAQGFSGESQRYTSPTTGESVVLRKTYMMRFVLPGSLAGQGGKPLAADARPRWVLR